MSGELAVREDQSLALDGAYWSDTQLKTLEHLGVEKASEGDLRVYHHVCQRTGLDPFARQIYMIERQGKQTIQTGIDGFRLVARRAVDQSGETFSISEPQWCGKDGVWRDVWLEDGPPMAARVTITRGSGTFVGIALWREYVQTTWQNGSEVVTKMWRTRPAGQLAKCAEALGLRKAFPQDLAGIYTDDEMASANVVQGEVVAEAPARVTASDLVGDGETVDGEVVEDAVTASQLKKIGAAMRDLSITDRTFALQYVADVIKREVSSRNELTKGEAHKVIEQLEFDLKAHREEEAKRQKDAPDDVEDQVANNDPALDGGQ